MSSLRALLGDVVGGGSVPEKIFYVYNNNRGMTNNGCCCLWTVPASIKNAGPFFVLVNRGKCHFTEKVAHAQAQGARGVIVKDNKYLRGQPVSYCPGPHYEEPKRKNTGNNIWEPCVAETGSAANTDQCYCYETGKTIYGTTNKAKPLPTMPQCADGGETAEYVPAGGQCDPTNGISAPCWKCTDGTFHASNCVLDQQNCVTFRLATVLSSG